MLFSLKGRLRVGSARAESRRRLDRWDGGRPHGLPVPLVVSLTSHPPRFGALADTLRGLIAQTVRPDAVVLWLGQGAAASLPAEVLALRAQGLEVRETRDLRSFTKVVPSLLAFPEACVVTADDDIHYGGDWLGALVEGARGDPRLVLGHRAHRIRLGLDGRPLRYVEWDRALKRAERGAGIFPTGVTGVMYPPGSLHPEAVRDDLFMELCPSADDVWLWWMHRMTGGSAAALATRTPIVEWPGTQGQRLSAGNIKGGGNDRAVEAMRLRYGLPLG